MLLKPVKVVYLEMKVTPEEVFNSFIDGIKKSTGDIQKKQNERPGLHLSLKKFCSKLYKKEWI